MHCTYWQPLEMALGAGNSGLEEQTSNGVTIRYYTISSELCTNLLTNSIGSPHVPFLSVSLSLLSLFSCSARPILAAGWNTNYVYQQIFFHRPTHTLAHTPACRIPLISGHFSSILYGGSFPSRGSVIIKQPCSAPVMNTCNILGSPWDTFQSQLKDSQLYLKSMKNWKLNQFFPVSVAVECYLRTRHCFVFRVVNVKRDRIVKKRKNKEIIFILTLDRRTGGQTGIASIRGRRLALLCKPSWSWMKYHILRRNKNQRQ